MAPLLQKSPRPMVVARSSCASSPSCIRSAEISIDYAVLEPRSAKGETGSEITACRRTLPGTIWARGRRCTSIGPEPGRETAMENVCDGASAQSVVIDARGNYVFALGKVVALMGVNDLVVVETPDALLITTRERSQEVGKVVAELKARGRDDLI